MTHDESAPTNEPPERSALGQALSPLMVQRGLQIAHATAGLPNDAVTGTAHLVVGIAMLAREKMSRESVVQICTALAAEMERG